MKCTMWENNCPFWAKQNNRVTRISLFTGLRSSVGTAQCLLYYKTQGCEATGKGYRLQGCVLTPGRKRRDCLEPVYLLHLKGSDKVSGRLQQRFEELLC